MHGENDLLENSKLCKKKRGLGSSFDWFQCGASSSATHVKLHSFTKYTTTQLYSCIRRVPGIITKIRRPFRMIRNPPNMVSS